MRSLTLDDMRNADVIKNYATMAGSLYPGDYFGGVMKQDENRRGMMVYYPSQLMPIIGITKNKELLTEPVDSPFFYLTLAQRYEIARLCPPVFGIVTSRMNRIAAINFSIIPKRKEEDRVVAILKQNKEIADEYQGAREPAFILARIKAINIIKQELPEVLPDLSNFAPALRRWRSKITWERTDRGQEIRDWLEEPNQGVRWNEYVKKVVFDAHIHGATATYKQRIGGKLENFDTLPGGTVFRITNPYFSGHDAYVQVTSMIQPQIFYPDEVAYSTYLPTSNRGYGLIPLEALMSNITEWLMFDSLMAAQADGTKPPEKVVIIGNKNPFGDFDGDESLPIDTNEQARIEQKFNSPKKHRVVTFTGNTATVLDLSKADTMGAQNARQKDLREIMALVFNMSNMEVNMSGSESTSGRATSEEQGKIEYGKGIQPLLQLIQEQITYEIIPFRFGPGYMMEFETGEDKMAKEQLDQIRLNNGKVTVNELREEENAPQFTGEENNRPRGSQVGAEVGGSEINPLMVKQIGR